MRSVVAKHGSRSSPSRWFESSSRKLSAGSLYIQTQGRSDVVEEEISSRKLLFTSRCYLEIAIAKRCRLHKLIRQRFALALKIQQEDFALLTSRKIQSKLQWIQSQRKDFQTQCLCIQTQGDKSIVVEEDSGEAIDKPDASNSSIQSSEAVDDLRRVIKVGCQLLSLIQMAKTTRSLQKKRTQVLFPVVPVQARRRKTHVYVVSHTVEAGVHLWSLGVLTAAGCGIGSVHEVVRSNLLVEPSEVEEGEM
ncbi:hypothetical protein F511_39076 [Dorcoceras hygrometricum]|uniref:Uncharacterized protein n=1 Tax=Dorcoceras hygrometricum TaxID=472368 RepID=A0A2Z7CQC6_9LAMI|nr:hypothetical protein F511_39076 [Dorcoceras hygrometricum]